MNLIVSKFGGTSVGNAEAIKKVSNIILEEKGRKIIVVSAVSGVTDLLIKAGLAASKSGRWVPILTAIKKKHALILDDLDLKTDLSLYWSELESILGNIKEAKELTPRNRDYLLSFGERLSTKIVADYLGKNAKTLRINTRHIIKTDDTFGNAQLDYEKTKEAISKILIPNIKKFEKIVITGFIGANAEGQYTTFSRGGSDYTAAILASILNAKELEIWTDVDGVLTADPRIIAEAKVVENISYREAAELAYFGAKVLHPKTIKPVIKKNIPIRVRNTFNPKQRGTLITKTSKIGPKSISQKNGFYVINLYADETIESYGFLAKIFSLFLKHKIIADVISTGEDSISVTVDSRPPTQFIQELKECADVEVLPGKAIVCLVGEDLNLNSGSSVNNTYSRLFTSIKKYPVSMVSQNHSAKNIAIVVGQKEAEEVIKSIYKEFFRK